MKFPSMTGVSPCFAVAAEYAHDIIPDAPETGTYAAQFGNVVDYLTGGCFPHAGERAHEGTIGDEDTAAVRYVAFRLCNLTEQGQFMRHRRELHRLIFGS